MKRAIPLFIMTVVLTVVVPAWSELILESAYYPEEIEGRQGTVINSGQYIGVRFHVDNHVKVSAVGGLMYDASSSGSTGSFFGAIIRLEDSAALPIGFRIDPSELIGSTLFQITPEIRDYLFPLSATLSPGDYALVFGSGQFGATGAGMLAMYHNNMVSPPDTLNEIVWSQVFHRTWSDYPDPPEGPHRFLVEADIIPEPATVSLLAFGGLLLRKRK